MVSNNHYELMSELNNYTHKYIDLNKNKND